MTPRPPALVQDALGDSDTTLLDLVDNLLDRGVVLTGEVTLGLAGVDLVYLRLSILLAAADRVLRATQGEGPPGTAGRQGRRSRE